MLTGCYYHQLDSLLPPLPSTTLCEGSSKVTDDRLIFDKSHCNDFLRLEYLSACKIMQDVLTADRYLPLAPYRLYPALFQAIAHKQFQTWKKASNHLHTASTLSLISLMQYWPYEEMTVRELMPSMFDPVARKADWHGNIRGLREDMDSFCSSFLNVMPFSFLSRFSSNQTEKQYPLSKLDISGLYEVICDTMELKNLEVKVKNAYNPNSPPQYDKCELVIDAFRLDGEVEQLSTLGVICTLSAHHGAGLVIKFRRVHILAALPKQVASLIDILAKSNATEYLELEMCVLSEDVMSKILKMSETLTGLSLAYNNGFSSIEFLTLLPNLCHLNISGVNLCGKLHPLNSLCQGLKYLKLVGCGLKLMDVDVLASSCHTKSLLQLDLSENLFNNPASAASLCNLCMELEKLVILELENCNLHKISAVNVRESMDILSSMPRLRVLRLTNNDFSSRVIREHLPHLASSMTLQYLSLTVPGDTYLSDDYNVVESEIKRIKSDFAKQVQVISGRDPTSSSSKLFVEWNEEITYSHWYYSV